METLIHDIRFGWRMLRKSPAFTLVAVLTLALGVGANTAIFTLINAVMLKTLPVNAPAELVVVGDPLLVHTRSIGSPRADLVSYPLYREARDHNQVFSGLLASCELSRMRVAATGSPEDLATNVLGVMVSGNYFQVLGIRPLMGRMLAPGDESLAGANPVAVVSFSFWKDKLGADAGVVGRELKLNNYPFTVVGVAPAGFYGDAVGDQQQVWLPITMQQQVMPGRQWLEDANASWIHMIGRLKPGMSLAQAGANMNMLLQQAAKGSLGARLAAGDRENLVNARFEVSPGGAGFSVLRGASFRSLLVIMAFVALVMGIACVNVANLLLARASARQREIAVRLALGAGAGRVIRQLLTESLMLALAGGLVGLAVARWGTSGLLALSNNSGLEASPDWRVFAFTAGICLLTGVLFGLVPALRSRQVQITPALKATPQSLSNLRTGWNWGKGLVAGQVTLSLLVLFASGLLVRTMQNCRNVDLGYNREGLLMVSTDPVAAGYKDAQITAIATQLTEQIAALPGVRAVTYSKNGLFSGSGSSNSIKVEGYQPRNDDDTEVGFEQVGPGYFASMGVPVLMGRDLGPQDTASSQKVAVINQTMARFYFGNANPLGRRIHMDDPRTPLEMSIVGVARDVRSNELREEVPRRMYIPAAQLTPTAALILAIRVAGDPAPVADAARRQIRSLNASIPVISVKTLDDLVNSTLRDEILIARLSALFAAIALLLACIGLYGIMSYAVSGRTREIGVRMALGAPRLSVLWLVLRDVFLLVGAGMAIGIPVALLGSRLISSMLYGVKSTDPVSMGLVLLLLAAVATLAGLIPARRAMKVDPMIALRYE